MEYVVELCFRRLVSRQDWVNTVVLQLIGNDVERTDVTKSSHGEKRVMNVTTKSSQGEKQVTNDK